VNAIKKTGMAVGLLAVFVMLTACASGKSIKQGTEEFSVPEAKYHEALSLYDDAMYFESIQAWTEVLDSEPRFAQGQFNIGLIYDKLNMIPEAIEHYELAVQFQEDSMVVSEGNQLVEEKKNADGALALFNLHLGAAYLRAGLVDEAMEALNEALRLDVYNPTVHYNLSAGYMAKENFEDGLKHADVAVDLATQPGPGADGLAKDVDRVALGNYLLRQAECHALRGEWDKARACVDRARAQCKAEPEASLKKMLNDQAAAEAKAKAEKEGTGE
jgi:tetratricopeptide (TPR) repeat protein